MKSLLRFAIIALGIVAAGAPVLAADTSARETSSSVDTNRPTRTPGAKRAMHRARALKRLQLSEAQRGQLKEMRLNARNAMRAIRADTALTPDVKKARVREVAQKTKAEMKGVLTPAQQAKMHKMLVKARHRHRR